VQCSRVFCDNDEAGRILVKPVYNARPEFGGIQRFGVPADMVQDGVCQGAGPVAECRVHNHAGFLVDNHQVAVFIHDIDRDVFRGEFRCGRTQKGDQNGIA